MMVHKEQLRHLGTIVAVIREAICKICIGASQGYIDSMASTSLDSLRVVG